jgi:hypothetical protein
MGRLSTHYIREQLHLCFKRQKAIQGNSSVKYRQHNSRIDLHGKEKSNLGRWVWEDIGAKIRKHSAFFQYTDLTPQQGVS